MIADTITVEALLVARRRIYTLAHKVLGGYPTAELLTEVTCLETRDAFEEYARGDELLFKAFEGLQEQCRSLGDDLDAARDEFSRVFVGPFGLPALPFESPWRTDEPALFQANTVMVRALYRLDGFELKRINHEPDDHIAAMCGYMAQISARSLDLLRAGNVGDLAQSLRVQAGFVEDHMLNWVPAYAAELAALPRRVLYPQFVLCLAEFIRIDQAATANIATWSAKQQDDAGASPQDPAYVEARKSFARFDAAEERLGKIEPFGIADRELRRIA